jgi:hypothetical protein
MPGPRLNEVRAFALRKKLNDKKSKAPPAHIHSGVFSLPYQL